MYFVPRTFMERVDIFEDFITLLSGLNKKQTPLVVNSFYIIDDAKQRDKMTEEFYLAVKKEIAAYQEKCDYLIKSSSQSPAVLWNAGYSRYRRWRKRNATMRACCSANWTDWTMNFPS